MAETLVLCSESCIQSEKKHGLKEKFHCCDWFGSVDNDAVTARLFENGSDWMYSKTLLFENLRESFLFEKRKIGTSRSRASFENW